MAGGGDGDGGSCQGFPDHCKKELSDSLRIPELFKNPFYHNDYARYEENGAQ